MPAGCNSPADSTWLKEGSVHVPGETSRQYVHTAGLCSECCWARLAMYGRCTWLASTTDEPAAGVRQCSHLPDICYTSSDTPAAWSTGSAATVPAAAAAAAPAHLSSCSLSCPFSLMRSSCAAACCVLDVAVVSISCLSYCCFSEASRWLRSSSSWRLLVRSSYGVGLVAAAGQHQHDSVADDS